LLELGIEFYPDFEQKRGVRGSENSLQVLLLWLVFSISDFGFLPAEFL
jgi:hypothetical protein